MQHQQQQFQNSLSQPAYFILASLVQGPKHAVELREAIEQREGVFIEPGTLYRALAHLERRGWIEELDEQGLLRRYRLTTLGILALEQAAAGRHREKPREDRSLGWLQGKEIIMRLVLWILHLYPPAWRERYEAEMVALLEQHHITPWTVLDLLVGALDARLDPHYRRARQILPLRRFQTSWRLVIGALVAFWIALFPWLWMSILGISPDNVRCSDWGNNYALCMMRVTVGMHGSSLAQTLVGMILGFLPILLIAFTIILVQARGRKARTHLLLVLPVTIGMLVLCISCGIWLRTLWPLLPQISHFYPQTPAALLAGLTGMGLATVLALGSLARAAFALRVLSAASPKQEPGLYTDQLASVVHGRGHAVAGGIPAPQAGFLNPRGRPGISGRPGSVPKRWVVLLVVLLLLFAFPLPLLVPPDGSSLFFWLIIWCPAGIVGLITARLVKSPGKKQAERVPQKPRRATSPLVWAAILPLAFFLLTSGEIPSAISLPVPLRVKLSYLLLYFFFAAFVSGMTAMVVTIRRRWPHLERTLRYVGIGAASVLSILVALRLGHLLGFGQSFQPWAAFVGWLLVSCLSITPALFVRVPGGHQQVERATDPLFAGAAPKVWALFLLVLLVFFTFRQLGPAILLIANLFILMAICLIPALIVKIRNSNQQVEGTAEPLRNSLSPRVWIIISPVLFLIIFMEIEFIFMPDYPNLEEAFIAWLLTGLASLIILLVLKLGSKKSTNSAPQEALQQVQVQG